MAQEGETETFGTEVDGVRIWRLRWPRHHTHLEHANATPAQKLTWHVQDHFDPRNRKLLARVLDEFKPEIALVRVISGIGYNSAYELAKRDIPTICFMHDLNLVCGKSDMFNDGKPCERRCALCKVTSRVRFAAVSSIPRVSFCSPSRAVLEISGRHLPLSRFSCASILNANRYPEATLPRSTADHVRFLYVGRLHRPKGIDILLQAADQLADARIFTLTVVGTGPEEAELRRRFGSRKWCTFTGMVPQTEVSNHMANSDVLCIPSIWMENSPGVAIHALSIGLPVIGSNRGGIPEYIEHDENGLLVEPADASSWRDAMMRVLDDPSALQRWRMHAIARSYQFDQDFIGQKIVNHMIDTINLPSKWAPATVSSAAT